jgi:hypothetical protein
LPIPTYVPVAGPALRLIGSAISTSAWVQQGIGETAQNIVEEGGDVRGELPTLILTGALYAAVENLQVKQVSDAGLLKGWRKALYEYVKGVVLESHEEGVQETVMYAGAVKVLKEQGLSDGDIAKVLGSKYWEAFKDSFVSMAMVGIPGKAVGGARHLQSKRSAAIRGDAPDESGGGLGRPEAKEASGREFSGDSEG